MVIPLYNAQLNRVSNKSAVQFFSLLSKLICIWQPNYSFFIHLSLAVPPQLDQPCQPSPCGANAVCRKIQGVATCSCLPEYIGNPYEGCRPECSINSDCPSHLACVRSKCQNPCPGTCGSNADCQVVNHLPICTCTPHYTGNPYSNCFYEMIKRKFQKNLLHINWGDTMKYLSNLYKLDY